MSPTTKPPMEKRKWKETPIRPAKKSKTGQELIKSKFHRLHDQLADGYYEKALKTCNQILVHDENNILAAYTRSLLLLTLDQFSEALTALSNLHAKKPPADSSTIPSESEVNLAIAYCHYKLGRELETRDEINLIESQGYVNEDFERGVSALKAQTLYRLEHYQESSELYQDLISTLPQHLNITDLSTSAEFKDLTSNLSASKARSTFASNLNTLLLNPRLRLSKVEVLETNSIIPLLSTFTTQVQKKEEKKSVTSTKPSLKLKIEEDKKSDSKLDPERWLPKRQRTGFIPQRSKRQQKLSKAAAKVATQGSSTTVQNVVVPVSSSQTNKKKKKRG